MATVFDQLSPRCFAFRVMICLIQGTLKVSEMNFSNGGSRTEAGDMLPTFWRVAKHNI